MSLIKASMTLALCFGLGLGLAPLVRSANACSCEEEAYWQLERERIEGGDIVVEQEFWPTDRVTLSEGYYPVTQLSLYEPGFQTTLELERMP